MAKYLFNKDLMAAVITSYYVIVKIIDRTVPVFKGQPVAYIHCFVFEPEVYTCKT